MKKSAQSSRTSGTSGATLALVGGISAGVLAMYFLDPRSGKNRRDRIASTVQDLTEQGREIGHRLGEHAAQVAHAARHSVDSARATGASATESGREAIQSGLHSVDQAREYIERAVRNAKELAADPARRQRGPILPLAEMALSGMAALACGLGAMYFLDPTTGAKRRKAAIDLAAEGIQNTGCTMRFVGRQLRSALQGVAPSLARYLPEEDENEPAVAAARDTDNGLAASPTDASAAIPSGASGR